MMKSIYLSIILFIAALSLITGFSEDGDLSRQEHVCVTMHPVHPDGNDGFIPPQQGPSPFILMTPNNRVPRGGHITVSLTSVMNKTDIQGYYIQARKLEDYNTIVGSFIDYNNHGMLFDCQSERDTLLHNGTHLKYQPLMFQWVAPLDCTGTVIFWASVAESYQRYWIGVYSTPIDISC